MSTGWENYESAPLEHFHGLLMDAFHKLRLQKSDNESKTLTLHGGEFNNMIAAAKTATYAKYPNHVNNEPILKTELLPTSQQKTP